MKDLVYTLGPAVVEQPGVLMPHPNVLALLYQLCVLLLPTLMPVPMEEMRGTSVAIFRSSKAEGPAWISLEDFDLSEVDSVKVGVTTSSMFTRGGALSLRLGSADGELVAEHMVENTNLGIPDTMDYFSFDVSQVEGRHDLYISTGPPQHDSAKPDYILGTVEFRKSN